MSTTEDLQPGMYLTKQMMDDSGIPVDRRDRCAHLLIPLTQCRKETLQMPWACNLEHMAYDFCQYKEQARRHDLSRPHHEHTYSTSGEEVHKH